jgi:DNA (cytosine-5)-methyltransferase 1
MRYDLNNDTYVTAFSHTQGLDAQPSTEAWPSLRKNGGGQGVGVGVGVRRLTPVECERLQDWPDGWTDPTGDAPDSRRYAACGDGVTASVAEWIGRRLLAAAVPVADTQEGQ